MIKVWALVADCDEGGYDLKGLYSTESVAEEHRVLEDAGWPSSGTSGYYVAAFDVLDEIDGQRRAMLGELRSVREQREESDRKLARKMRAVERRRKKAEKEMAEFRRIKQLERRKVILAARVEREAKA